MTKYTIHDLITHITQQIKARYDSQEFAQLDAWVIAEQVTGLNRTQLLVKKEITLTAQEQEKLELVLHQLTVLHKPLQYIIGHVPFLDLTLKIVSPILIPRPETEAWCEELINRYKKASVQPQSILDLCTGSGCIALALAQAFPQSHVLGVDINETALELARINQKINGLTNCSFIHSNLFEQLEPKRKYDIIVANPPYISKEEWQHLPPEVALWEDPHALIADDQGLHLIYKILIDAHKYLIHDFDNVPTIWIEIGSAQGPKVLQKAQELGYKKASILKDIYHNDRVLIASL